MNSENHPITLLKHSYSHQDEDRILKHPTNPFKVVKQSANLPSALTTGTLRQRRPFQDASNLGNYPKESLPASYEKESFVQVGKHNSAF